MGYITQELTKNEKMLINKLWNILKGEELGGISARNLLFFLIGIHQLKIDQLYLKKKKSNESLNISNLMSSDIDIDQNSIQIPNPENKSNGR